MSLLLLSPSQIKEQIHSVRGFPVPSVASTASPDIPGALFTRVLITGSPLRLVIISPSNSLGFPAGFAASASGAELAAQAKKAASFFGELKPSVPLQKGWGGEQGKERVSVEQGMTEPGSPPAIISAPIESCQPGCWIGRGLSTQYPSLGATPDPATQDSSCTIQRDLTGQL